MALEDLCDLARHIKNGTFGFHAGHMHSTSLNIKFLGLGPGCHSGVGYLLNMCEAPGSNITPIKNNIP